MKIFLVVPVYNESLHLNEVVKNLLSVNLPVVVVDDGSVDKTPKILAKFKDKSSKFIVLTHRINLGKGAAMKTGAEAAFKKGAEAVIFMDGDGQHLISDLPKFIAKLEEGYDVVFGSRAFVLGVPLVRYLGNKLASILVNFLFGIYISDVVCGFRALTEKAFQRLNLESTGYGVETEMVVKIKKNKLNYCEVPVETVYKDNYKGVTIMDALGIFFDLIRWRLTC